MIKKLFLGVALFGGVLLASVATAFNVTPPIDLHFFEHDLGLYAINFQPTLQEIKTLRATHSDWPGEPFFEKPWMGACPGGLTGNSGTCIEFTVYPSDTNFRPAGIMQNIEKYTQGVPNRGEVRILTDQSMAHYVYTTDHEATFHGPYDLS